MPKRAGKIWAAVILAAGNGVRMCSERPKALHEVCGVSMLEHVAAAVREAGVERVIVVAQPGFARLPDFLAAAGPGAEIAVQERPAGTADALMAARSLAGDASALLVGIVDTPLIGASSLELLLKSQETPNTAISVLSATPAPCTGLGRIVRGSDGEVRAIVEEVDADAEVAAIEEVNGGWYAFDAAWLWDSLPDVEPSAGGELYLTDLVSMAHDAGKRVEAVVTQHPREILGVNDRIQLAEAEREMRDRIRRRWMRKGVTLIDPETTYIDAHAELMADVTLRPNTHILGRSRVGRGCDIGPDAILVDTELAEDGRFVSSHAEAARVGRRANVGPFSRLRPGTELADDVFIGNYVEVKNSTVGSGTHIGHFSYIGDAVLGRRVNIGAGTVTCNYDGANKHRTVIGDDVFIGSGTMLVAPISVGDRAHTGAGAVAISDVDPDTTVVGAPARLIESKEPATEDSGDVQHRSVSAPRGQFGAGG